jgi:hypothetical protein
VKRAAVRSAGVVLAVTLAGIVWAWAMAERLGPGRAAGFGLGAALAGIGAATWIGAAAWAATRGQKAFMSALGLGILGRLVIYGATLLYVTLRTRVDPVWTAGALMGFYVLFMVEEIRFALGGLNRPAR